MAELDNLTKSKLESILEMSGGYVLDFTNATFADFIETAIGIDPYSKYDPTLSKARLLRTIWANEPEPSVAKLILDLLEHWRVSALLNEKEPTSNQIALCEELRAQFEPLVATQSVADTEFLAKDFGEIDLAQLPRALASRDVIQARLKEIDACLTANAPLAVIFLVGSTLEGLLLDLAKAQADAFTAADGAPKDKKTGKVRPLDRWRLVDLIVVSHSLGVLRDDVFKFADQVRNFRNYIHPRQQLAEGFAPRIHTAQIAQHVLMAALADLQSASEAAAKRGSNST